VEDGAPGEGLTATTGEGSMEEKQAAADAAFAGHSAGPSGLTATPAGPVMPAAIRSEAIAARIRAGEVAQLLPPAELAPVAPSLREKFAALPDEQRAGVRWERLSPVELYRDLDPSEAMAAMVDVAGHRMLSILRSHAGRIEGIEANEANFTEVGLDYEMSDARAAAQLELDQVANAVAGELGRLDREAEAAITRFQGATYAVAPDVELVARQRWQDALAGGKVQVAQLFDGVIAAGDASAAQAVLRIAQAAIASADPNGDTKTFARAQAVAPLVAELANRVMPPEARRATATRTAAAEALQRVRVLRAALGA
jgi:hypothetical protein